MGQPEAKGPIELATLRLVLDRTLVYALVPNKPLETIVEDRARGETIPGGHPQYRTTTT